MPTFRHVPTGKKFFLVHIPRTAGRFIESNLIQNNNFVWDEDINFVEKFEGAATKFYNSPWYDIEIGGVQLVHHHKELYKKYVDDSIPHVSVIRHPISRFISSSFLIKRYYGDEIELLQNFIPLDITTQSWFLEDFNFCNWHRPQIDFLTKKTHIWKFENGIGSNFFKWLSSILNIDLQYTVDVNYYKDEDEKNKMTLTQFTTQNLENFYKKDIKLFNSLKQY